MSHHFLSACRSAPKTLADLRVGDKFIVFPGDHDDPGRLRGGARLLVKVEPYRAGPECGDDVWLTCREYGRPYVREAVPAGAHVIQVYGVA